MSAMASSILPGRGTLSRIVSTMSMSNSGMFTSEKFAVMMSTSSNLPRIRFSALLGSEINGTPMTRPPVERPN